MGETVLTITTSQTRGARHVPGPSQRQPPLSEPAFGSSFYVLPPRVSDILRDPQKGVRSDAPVDIGVGMGHDDQGEVAVTGEAATFEAMYASNVRDVLAYCLRRAPSADANDATAEVFAVAWRRLADLPDHPETLPWLYGVAANVLKNQSRSTRRARKLSGKIGSQPELTIPGPEAQVVRRAEYEEVHRAIDSLKPKYREVLKLVEWEELPRAVVAEMLSISRAAVDQRIHRAYEQLERRLTHLSHSRPDLKGGEHGAQQAS